MFIILIFAYSIFCLIRYDYHKNLLRAMIDAGVVFSALTVFCAELLSIFSAYQPIYVFSFWFIICAACVFVFRGRIVSSVSRTLQAWKSTFWQNHSIKSRSDIRNKPPHHWLFLNASNTKTLKNPEKKKGNQSNPKQTNPDAIHWPEYAAFAVIALFCIGTLVTALIYPPTNYDSQVYHLPRVFYWLKNGSVHNYPAYVARQLYTGPFNAFWMMQTVTLSHGSDLFLNLSQWFSYVGSIIISALVASELGLRRRWQVVSALLATTIPLSILQASTTQNDLTSAFWCAATVYYALRLINDGQLKNWFDAGIFTGLSAGIAALTKLSAGPALVSFAIMFICLKLRKRYLKRLLYTVGIVLCCAILICAGFFIRNAIDLDGDFLALNAPEMKAEQEWRILPINYRAAILAKNLLFNFGSRSEALSTWVYDMTDDITSFLGVELDDPNITLNSNPYKTYHNYYNYDVYPNPFHSLLILLSVLVFAVYCIKNKSKLKNNKVVLAYSSACVASFFITASSFLWISSASRYLLPCLPLAMPFCAFVFASMRPARMITVPFLICVVFLGAGPLFFNGAQPLVTNQWTAYNNFNMHISPVEGKSRKEILDYLLFAEDADFTDKAERIIISNNITKIGMHFNMDVYPFSIAVYPILSRFWDERFEVANIYPYYHNNYQTSFTPQAIFSVALIDDISPIEFNGKTYVPVISSPNTTNTKQYALLLDEGLGLEYFE